MQYEKGYTYTKYYTMYHHLLYHCGTIIIYIYRFKWWSHDIVFGKKSLVTTIYARIVKHCKGTTPTSIAFEQKGIQFFEHSCSV